MAWMRCLGAAAAVAVAFPACGWVTLLVDDNAPPRGDGLAWTTAFRYLQDALAAAAAPGSGVTEVRVAQGVYRPDESGGWPAGTGDRSASFELLQGVTLRGGYVGLGQADPDGHNVALYPTVLSGDLNVNDGPGFANSGENSYHVVTAFQVDGTAILDGFKVRGGRADGPSAGADPESKNQGSAVNVFDATPALTNCTFTGNWASNHAAVNDHGGSALVNEERFIRRGVAPKRGWA